jgi:site-specific recombinase XerD
VIPSSTQSFRVSGIEAKAGIQPPAPHDFRRTWTGDLLDAGVDLATVQNMAGHASVSTTARYDRRDHAVQRKAAGLLHVPYVQPED